MGKITRKVGVVAAALSVAYFVLWGCMPMTAMPPPVPSAGGEGGSVQFVAYDEEPKPSAWHKPKAYKSYGLGYQRWRLFEREKFDWALIGHVGVPSLAGVGGMIRAPLVKSEKSYLGVSASVGLIWANIGLPMSVALGDATWLYSRPALTGGLCCRFHVPLGLVHETASGRPLYHEIGLQYGKEDLGGGNNVGLPMNILYYSFGWGASK